jgi:hypothetical protein
MTMPTPIMSRNLTITTTPKTRRSGVQAKKLARPEQIRAGLPFHGNDSPAPEENSGTPPSHAISLK